MGNLYFLLTLASLITAAAGLQCFLCGTGEPSNFCNATTFATNCKDDTQVCHITTRNSNGRLFSEKGCLAKEECQQRRFKNGRYCSEGVVMAQAPCTLCCTGDKCNRDLFNYGVVRTTTMVPPNPTRRAGPPAPGHIDRDFQTCLDDYKKLVKLTVSDPTENFPVLCRELPYILLCLASSNGQTDEQKKQAEATANYLWALCPRDCDVAAGDNCTTQFVSGVTDIIVGGQGDQCAQVQHSVGQYITCLDYNVGSCGGATAQRYALTLKAIKRESDTLCLGDLSQVSTTPPTEPADCQVETATNRVKTLTTHLLRNLFDGQDVQAFCTQHLPNTEKFLQSALASCSSATSTRVRSALQISKNLLGLSCDQVTPPPLCDVSEARKCIVNFWTMVDEADDMAKYCNLIKPTRECVARYTAGCEEKERKELEKFLQVFIDRIGNKCDDVIEASAECGKNISLKEGGPLHQLQVKMVKSPDELCAGQNDCKIYVDLIIKGIDSHKCPNGQDSKQIVCKEENGQPCSRHITAATWRRSVTFHLLAAVDNQMDGNVTVEVNILIRKVINGATTEKRTVCTVLVLVIDADKPAGGTCASSNDPHIHTFDQWYYNNHIEGLFLMYRHRIIPAEVQAIFQACNRQKATCNCGIAVRSGNFVFVVESCRRKQAVCDRSSRHICNKHGQVRIYSYGDAKDPAMRIFVQGPNYEIIFPHGTRVSIQFDALHKLFNFVIHASVFDWGPNTVEGLCGNFDGDKMNDLRTSKGTVYRPLGRKAMLFPDQFSVSWRLPHDQSIFSGNSGSKQITARYCPSRMMGDMDCDIIGLVEYCHLTLGVELPLSRMAVKPSVTSTNTRNKRSTEDDLVGIIELDETATTSPEFKLEMSEEAATAYCSNYLKEKEEWSKLCMELPAANDTLRMKACVEDLALTGDADWADTALEGLKQDCITHLTKDVDYLETFEGKKMKENIMKLTCPGMCSGNGVCADGKCSCTAPYTGFNCSSLPQNAIPQFISLFDNGLCDVTRGNCSNVVLFGTNFIDTPSLTCHFRALQITSSGANDLQTEFDIKATFVSDNQILCPTPQLVTPGGNVGWKIDVSNDGRNPSLSPVLLVSRDPLCAVCKMDANNTAAACTRMANTCIIGNRCFGAGERNPRDSCQRCDPQYSTTKWNYITLCTLNVAALIIVLLLLFIVVAIVIYCVCRSKKNKSANAAASAPPLDEKTVTVTESKPVRLTTR